MQYPGKTLIFMHIPKCAGSTLTAILQQNFPECKRFHVNPMNIVASRKKLILLPDEDRDQIDLLYGHLSFGWHEPLDRDAVYFTVVRHPVARITSHYNYVLFGSNQNHYLHDEIVRKNMSIADYVTSGVSVELNNGQVRLFAGVEDIPQEPYGKSMISYGTNDPALLDMAMNHAERWFALIGIQECFDETLILLRDILGIRDITYRSLNIGKADGRNYIVPSQKEIDTIVAYNKLDMALYNWALHRLYATLRHQRFSNMRRKN